MICLDVLRALNREPDTLAALIAELARARGVDHRLDAYLDELETELSDTHDWECSGRQITAMIATAVEAALLVRHSTTAVSDAFVASRPPGLHNRAFGSLPRGADMTAVIARSRLG